MIGNSRFGKFFNFLFGNGICFSDWNCWIETFDSLPSRRFKINILFVLGDLGQFYLISNNKIHILINFKLRPLIFIFCLVWTNTLTHGLSRCVAHNICILG